MIKTNRKTEHIIELVFILLPIFIILSIFFNKDFITGLTYNNDFWTTLFERIELVFCRFRSLDFGLGNFIVSTLGVQNNDYLAKLIIDLGSYFVFTKLIMLVYYLLGFFIDLIRSLMNRIGGIK